MAFRSKRVDEALSRGAATPRPFLHEKARKPVARVFRFHTLTASTR